MVPWVVQDFVVWADGLPQPVGRRLQRRPSDAARWSWPKGSHTRALAPASGADEGRHRCSRIPGADEGQMVWADPENETVLVVFWREGTSKVAGVLLARYKANEEGVASKKTPKCGEGGSKKCLPGQDALPIKLPFSTQMRSTSSAEPDYTGLCSHHWRKNQQLYQTEAACRLVLLTWLHVSFAWPPISPRRTLSRGR